MTYEIGVKSDNTVFGFWL